MKEALNNPNFENMLKELGLDSGPGSDGSIPSGRHRLTLLRNARQADARQGNTSDDGQGCKDIVADWKTFNTSGDKAVPGIDLDVDETETTNSINALNQINNR